MLLLDLFQLPCFAAALDSFTSVWGQRWYNYSIALLSVYIFIIYVYIYIIYIYIYICIYSFLILFLSFLYIRYNYHSHSELVLWQTKMEDYGGALFQISAEIYPTHNSGPDTGASDPSVELLTWRQFFCRTWPCQKPKSVAEPPSADPAGHAAAFPGRARGEAVTLQSFKAFRNFLGAEPLTDGPMGTRTSPHLL